MRGYLDFQENQRRDTPWFGIFLLGIMLLVMAYGCANAAPPTASGTAPTTNTNNNAPAGAVGEYVEANCAYAVSGTNVAFTSATPTVGTWASLPTTGTGTYACPFVITATAPTGLSTATNYWLVPINATTFHVSTTAANAIAGTFAATSGSTSATNITFAASITTGTTGVAGATVQLTAGDWDCDGSTYWVPTSTTSITNLQQSIGTSAVAVGVLGQYSDWETAANVVTVVNDPLLTTPTVRESLAATTTINLTNIAVFTASTLGATSDLRCRRVR